MDFTIYWSGAAEVIGAAPGLSNYRGQSSLHSPDTRAVRETRPARMEADYTDIRKRAQQRYQQRPEVKARRAAAERMRQHMSGTGKGAKP